MTRNNSKNSSRGSGPVRSEFIRFSDRKAIQLKLWGASPSKKYEGIMPAYVEVEEVTFSADGEPPKYGPSVRIPAKGDAFMALSYLEELLKEARQINRKERSRLKDEK